MSFEDWRENQDDEWAKNYPFSEDNVREFSKFCRESGGFYIG